MKPLVKHHLIPLFFLFVFCLSIQYPCYSISNYVNYSNAKFQEVLKDLSMGYGGGFIKDRDGFIWIGGLSGLVRWDGKRTDVFTASNSALSASMITGLYEDEKGMLWIATSGGGLNRYDSRKKVFISYRNDPSNENTLSEDTLGGGYSYHLMDEDSEGNLWIGSSRTGLNRMNKATGVVKRYRNDSKNSSSLSNDEVLIVYKDEEGTIWAGTKDGLNRYVPASDSFIRYYFPASDNQIMSILADRDGLFWIGTDKGRLYQLNRKSGSILQIPIVFENGTVFEQTVTSMMEDSIGNIWIAHGVNRITIFDKKNNRFFSVISSESGPFRLRGSEIDAIYGDSIGAVWIFSLEGHINKYHPDAFKFVLYQHDSTNIRSIPSDNVTRVFCDRQGTIWLDAYSVGFFKYNPKTDDFTRLRIPGLGHNAVMEDSFGNLWVGTNMPDSKQSLLCRLDRDALEFKETYPIGNGIFSTDLIEDRTDKDIFWFSTFNRGLGRFSKKTHETSYFTFDPENSRSIGSNSVWEVVQDDEDPYVLWLTVYPGGINRFDIRTQTFKRYTHDPKNPHSISGNDAYSIVQINNGELWTMAAGSGLNRFDKRTENFEHFSEKNKRFPHDAAINVIADDSGILWIGGVGKVVRFDPKTYQYQMYGVEDGVQAGINWGGAIVKGLDGRIWMGGAKGLNVFFPGSIKNSTLMPPVYLTAITQNGEPMGLDTAPEKLDRITLGWKNNFFEFEAAVLDFTHPDKNLYQYILEGWDKRWYQAGRVNRGRYSGLPGGDYTLRVRGTNSDGVWSNSEAALRILVTPPVWKTFWFKGGTIIIVFSSVIFIFFLRLRSIELRRQKLDLLVNERTRELADSNRQLKLAKEEADIANRSKSTFLANMSHELRTPLNTILGFSDLIIREFRSGRESLTCSQEENLNLIRKGGTHLLALINNVLDLSKIEAGKSTLNPVPSDLKNLLYDIEDMFSLKIARKGLSINLNIQENVPQYILADTVKLRQILINLMSNAMKFTERGGIILRISKLPYYEEDENIGFARLHFEVEDTGPGIPSDELGSLFQAFTQTTTGISAKQGTGLGLTISKQFVALMGGDLEVQSMVGKGSVFRFTINVKVLENINTDNIPIQKRVVGIDHPDHSFRVLLVDDNPGNLKLLVQILTPIGFELKEADNGKSAIELWKSWRPHIILMDMRMSIMNGLDATVFIKRLDVDQKTKIVAISASAFEEDREKILNAGCDAFIRKPFRENDLLEIIGRNLGITFRYEEERLQERSSDHGVCKLSRIENPLNTFSSKEHLLSIKDASIRGDIESLFTLIQQAVEIDDGLKGSLLKKLEAFDYQSIIELVDTLINVTE